MLSVYVPQGSTLERIVVEPGEAPPENAVWIDMVTPSVQEDRTVEQLIGIAVPTREEMQEIEVSSRLYVENGARYMTATLMCQSDTATPKTTAVTFILSGHRLVTVRYDEPRPFAIVEHKLGRSCPAKITGEGILMDLLDAVIDRSADILERIGARGRPGFAFDFRAGAGGSAAILQRYPQGPRTQGRSHVKSSREPGVGRPFAAVSRQ